MIARLSPAERVGVTAVGAVALAWILAAVLRRELFFDPVLFGLGSGAIIAALAIGLVVAFRASGVINFGHGAIATYVTYVYVSLVGTGRYPVPPLPNPLAPIEGIAGIEILDFPTFIDLGDSVGKVPALLISSLGAALLGRMSSFVIAAAAGLMLGVVDQELFRLELEWGWIPNIGIRRALPFLVIALAMVVRGESLPSRGALTVERLPEAVAPRITRGRMAGYGALIAVAFWLTVFAPFQYRAGMQNSMIGVILALSLVVVTGYVGQISLMQMALAGIGAFSVASFGTQAQMPLPVALPLAVAVGVGFGLIAAIPSLRTRGASLAIVTLASGLAIGEIFFKRPGWFGLDRGVKTADPPVLFGVEFGPNSDFVFGDGKIPTGGYGLFLLVVGIACCVSVMRLRRSRLGEQMLAVRANERAAAAAGVNVAAIKLSAFAISSFLAALGGALAAFNLGTYGANSFGIFASLTVLAFAYLGGISTVGGAITAGTLFAEGIGVVATEEWFIDVGPYTAYVAGFFLIGTAVYNNEGIDGFQRKQFHQLGAWLSRLRARRVTEAADV